MKKEYSEIKKHKFNPIKKSVIIIFILFIGCGVSKKTTQELLNKHPDWTSEQIVLIVNNKIEIGMTKEMVKASWGEPGYVNKTDGIYTGKIVTWSYYKIFATKIKVVTFKDGLVSSFSSGSLN